MSCPSVDRGAARATQIVAVSLPGKGWIVMQQIRQCKSAVKFFEQER
jgi:hypothetical protein